MELSSIFQHSPSFKDWVTNKKINSRELTILKEFSELDSLTPILKWIGKYQPSHSHGYQILELAGELLLMKLPLSDILEKEKNPKELVKQLKKLRYPLISQKDDVKNQIVKKLPWPSSIKGRWVRKNDQGSLEIQFNSSSIKDLEKKIEALETIKKNIKTEGNLWND